MEEAGWDRKSLETIVLDLTPVKEGQGQAGGASDGKADCGLPSCFWSKDCPLKDAHVGQKWPRLSPCSAESLAGMLGKGMALAGALGACCRCQQLQIAANHIPCS